MRRDVGSLAESECFDDEALFDLLAGRLSQKGVSEVNEHMATCSHCRKLAAEAARIYFSAGVPTDRSAAWPQRSVMTLTEPGTRIGRYEVRQPVGIGGMGVVYSAYDPELD